MIVQPTPKDFLDISPAYPIRELLEPQTGQKPVGGVGRGDE